MEAKKVIAIQAARKRKNEHMAEIYRIISVCLGRPPQPTEAFTWEFVDKNKKYHSVKTTPLDFYKGSGFGASQWISLSRAFFQNHLLKSGSDKGLQYTIHEMSHTNYIRLKS